MAVARSDLWPAAIYALRVAVLTMWQAPSSFAGQFAAIAYITGLQLGEPIPVDLIIGNAGLTMKVRPPGLQRRHLAAPAACLFPPAHVRWLGLALP
jgi:hypothetical protein